MYLLTTLFDNRSLHLLVEAETQRRLTVKIIISKKKHFCQLHFISRENGVKYLQGCLVKISRGLGYNSKEIGVSNKYFTNKGRRRKLNVARP